MPATLALLNQSARKRVCRRAALEALATRICTGERVAGDVEVSVLLCDDAYIAQLNRQYRNKNRPTDVLSFEQHGPETGRGSPLGDIVISLETAERNCDGDRARMRAEVEFLFCHGLLHLLGYDHATDLEREQMSHKQAEYLGLAEDAAWHFGSQTETRARSGPARRGDAHPIGR